MKEQIIENNQRSIFVRSWEVDSATANIFIAHGLGEHSGRYTEFAEHFNSLGFNVYAHDLQGHGKSAGKQGHIEHFEIYSDDQRFVIDTFSKKPLQNYLLGHSLGGVIATGFLIRYPELVSLGIISAPGYEKKIPPPFVKATIGKLLANLFPTLTLGNEIDASQISRSKKVVDEYLADPLVHDRVSTKFFTSFLAEYEFIKSNVSSIQTPCLMLLPGNDSIINHQVSKDLFKQFNSEKNLLVEYPDAYHEVLNEDVEKHQAYAEIENWLK